MKITQYCVIFCNQKSLDPTKEGWELKGCRKWEVFFVAYIFFYTQIFLVLSSESFLNCLMDKSYCIVLLTLSVLLIQVYFKRLLVTVVSPV